MKDLGENPHSKLLAQGLQIKTTLSCRFQTTFLGEIEFEPNCLRITLIVFFRIYSELSVHCSPFSSLLRV